MERVEPETCRSYLFNVLYNDSLTNDSAKSIKHINEASVKEILYMIYEIDISKCNLIPHIRNVLRIHYRIYTDDDRILLYSERSISIIPMKVFIFVMAFITGFTDDKLALEELSTNFNIYIDHYNALMQTTNDMHKEFIENKIVYHVDGNVYYSIILLVSKLAVNSIPLRNLAYLETSSIIGYDWNDRKICKGITVWYTAEDVYAPAICNIYSSDCLIFMIENYDDTFYGSENVLVDVYNSIISGYKYPNIIIDKKDLESWVSLELITYIKYPNTP